jgi:hypothetical protein
MYQWIFFTILGQLVPILYCYMNLIIENIKECKGSVCIFLPSWANMIIYVLGHTCSILLSCSQDIILLSSCLDEVLTDLAQIDVFS